MDADATLADVLGAFCVALLVWIVLVPLRERREAANGAGKPLKEVRVLDSPNRRLRIIGRAAVVLCMIVLGCISHMRMFLKVRSWPEEARHVLLMGLAWKFGLFVAALAAVFGAAGLARRVFKRQRSL